jgi:hypothetical protein
VVLTGMQTLVLWALLAKAGGARGSSTSAQLSANGSDLKKRRGLSCGMSPFAKSTLWASSTFTRSSKSSVLFKRAVTSRSPDTTETR